MHWIKRNLFLIFSVLISGGLMAGAVIYLLDRIEMDRTYDKSFKSKTQELQGYIQSAPSPDTQNVQAVQQEAAQVKAWATNALPVLSTPPVEVLDSLGFKSRLETVIAKLQEQASLAGVTVPARYSFTFAHQLPLTAFRPQSIVPLTYQLQEIEEIVHILFESRVHSLLELRRIRVDNDEPLGSEHYIDGKSFTTNGPVVITPYKVAFRGFSGELASVLNGFAQATNYIVVKGVQVRTMTVAPVPVAEVSAQPSLPTPSTRRTAPGRGTRGPGPGAAAPEPAGPTTILDEKPLRVDLDLEVIKAISSLPQAQAAGRAPGMPGMAPPPVPGMMSPNP